MYRGARMFGDIKDSNSVVSKVLAEAGEQVKVLRPEMETSPYVLYLGLEPEFQGKVEGDSALWLVRDSDGNDIKENFSEENKQTEDAS